MNKIKEQYIFFLDNKDSLVKKYPEKFIVISDKFEVYAFESKEEAYTFGVKTFGFGNMFIQECSETALSKVRKFHSRVYYK
ncbi:MAG: hypothetical protein IKV67_04100 [Paludibacteraceae bacterium]|nr:hypothetical protein [Paludibacteraceae bacterium]